MINLTGRQLYTEIGGEAMSKAGLKGGRAQRSFCLRGRIAWPKQTNGKDLPNKREEVSSFQCCNSFLHRPANMQG
jgi:hypothetical protein